MEVAHEFEDVMKPANQQDEGFHEEFMLFHFYFPKESSVRLGHKTQRTFMKRSSLW